MTKHFTGLYYKQSNPRDLKGKNMIGPNYTPEQMAQFQEQQRIQMQEHLRQQACMAILTALAVRSDDSDEQIVKRAITISSLFVNEYFKDV